MTVRVTDYVDIEARALELGLQSPGPLAILPRGFDAGSVEPPAHESQSATIRKLLKEGGVDAPLLKPADSQLPSVVQRGAEWIAPTIFIGSMLWTQNPMAVSVALGVLDSYVSDFLKGRLTSSAVKVSFVVERRKRRTYARVTYEGAASGLKDLAEVLRSVHDGTK